MKWVPKPNDSVEKLKKQKNYFFCQEDCKQFKCIIALVYKFYPTKKMQLVRMKEICICTLSLYTIAALTCKKDLDKAMEHIATKKAFIYTTFQIQDKGIH